jgi:hypothetical protein
LMAARRSDYAIDRVSLAVNSARAGAQQKAQREPAQC